MNSKKTTNTHRRSVDSRVPNPLLPTDTKANIYKLTTKRYFTEICLRITQPSVCFRRAEADFPDAFKPVQPKPSVNMMAEATFSNLQTGVEKPHAEEPEPAVDPENRQAEPSTGAFDVDQGTTSRPDTFLNQQTGNQNLKKTKQLIDRQERSLSWSCPVHSCTGGQRLRLGGTRASRSLEAVAGSRWELYSVLQDGLIALEHTLGHLRSSAFQRDLGERRDTKINQRSPPSSSPRRYSSFQPTTPMNSWKHTLSSSIIVRMHNFP